MKNRKKKRPSRKTQPVEIHRSDLAAPVGAPVDSGPSGLGRRDFLKLSLAAGGGLAAPLLILPKASAQGGGRVRKVRPWQPLGPDYDRHLQHLAQDGRR